MQEAEETGKASSGVSSEVFWPLVSVALQLTSQSCPVKTRRSGKSDNLVYLMDTTTFPLHHTFIPL